MFGNVKNKFNDFVSNFKFNKEEEYDYAEGYDEEFDDGYGEYDQESVVDEGYQEKRQDRVESDYFRQPQPRTSRNSSAVKMQIVKPTAFEEARNIILMLKDNQSVVLNLEYLNKEEARRIVDSVSGGLIALDGEIFKVTNSIFIAAPKGYQINDAKKAGVRNPGFSFMGN